MQVNSASFAPSVQTSAQQPARESNPQNQTPEQRNQQINDTLDKRNDLLQTQDQNQQQQRDNVATVATSRNEQNNLDTYTEAYQNATGGSSSSSSNRLDASDLRDINQTATRNEVVNSGALQNIADRQQQEPSPVYTIQGTQQQNQVGSTINISA